MEDKDDSIDHANDECVANNDVDFCSFYYTAVKRLLDIDNKENVSYLYRYAKIFSEYYNIFCQPRLDLEDQDNAMIKILKSCLYYRIIFVYRNATLVSSAVAFHLWNIYKKDPNILKRFVKKKIVRICSIGGSSASDVVAVITVLKSIALKIGIELDFRVTIIDFNADWKNTCITILSCIEEFHKATWKINFVRCNLANTDAWTSETKAAILEADIITMVKYISKINNKRNIVKMICSKLQSQAIFFVLDRPLTSLIELYLSVCDLSELQLVHVELCDYHTLDLEAVKRQRTLYQKPFRSEKVLRSNVSCDLFVSVWMKVSSETKTKLKNNLECVFQTNSEKYNPKQTFLGNNAFSKWEKLFKNKKRSVGWSKKRIEEYVQKEKEKRSNMFGKFIHEKKGMDSLQTRLLTEAQILENDGEEFSDINENSLDDYLVQKKQFLLTKKNAYISSLSANNLYFISE